jgi:tRNA dimethylallyltransferase
LNTLLVILGPTGVGKTELCLTVAQHLHVPIVNADSRQVYAEIPIGTAAPTPEQMRCVPHFFVGNHHLEDYYSASLYEQDVLHLLPKLFEDSKKFHPDHPVALLTGGSMMYIDAVCKGIDDIPTVDDVTRNTLKERLNKEGLDALVEELHQLDPEYWQIVDRKNPRRVVHALEICIMTGKPMSSFLTHQVKKRPFRILKIGLNRDRTELYNRINSRVLDMIDKGLIEEANSVYNLRSMNALNTVGFKEMFEYLDGLVTLDDTILHIQSNTRRYMRKQFTWFKRDSDIRWFHPDNVKEIINYIDDRLNSPDFS